MRPSATHLDPGPPAPRPDSGHSFNGGPSSHNSRCIAAVAMFTALSLGSTQALAQAPATMPPGAQPAPRSPEAPPSVDVPEPPPASEPAPPPELAPQPEPPPEPPPPESPPEPPPPMVGPTPPPTPAEPMPVVHDTTRGNQLRVAGVGTMIGGGVLAAIGFGLTLGFTIQGRKRHDDLAATEDQSQRQDCSRMTSNSCTQIASRIDELNDQLRSANKITQAGGATMLAGFLVIAAGGLVYRLGIRKLQPPALGRVKLSPSIGGVVLSGRF